MYDTMKDKRIGRAEVIEKFGVPPEKVIEVQALIGDSTDNVPGVPGIGVKTAAQLIGEYGDLETLLQARRRDQAGQAPPDADRQRREGAPLQAAGHARPEREARRAGRRPRRARAGLQEPDRLPQGDGVHHADAARGGEVRHRRQRDRSQCEAEHRRQPRPHRPRCRAGRAAQAPAVRQERRPVRAACRSRRPQPSGTAGANGDLTPAALAAAHLAAAQGAARSTAANTRRSRTLDRLEAWVRARQGHRRRRDRHRDHQPRSDAGAAVRLLARGRATTRPATCRSATARAAPRRRRPVRAGGQACARPDSGAGRARARSSRCWKTPACSRSART